MLNFLDDYPIHQTPEPIAHLATTDRNTYDRFFFDGFSDDGEWFFGIAMGYYPGRGIMDCAFSLVRKDGLQRSFFGSCRAPTERTNMRVGPFRIEIEVPMRRTRVILDDNESGLACDLTFSTRTGAIEEARQVLWSGARKVMDCTRFDQFGRWSGTIRSPDGDIAVDPSRTYGVKDRSWGVRKLGEPDTGGAPPQKAGGAFFLWAPLFWGDEISQAIIYDGTEGQPLIRDGMTAPFLASEPGGDTAEDGMMTRLATARHRITYAPGTRLATYAEIDLVGHDDSVRTVTFDPILRFHMKGIGYTHPEWGHGYWKGELAIGHEVFDPAQIDLLAPYHFHTQQVCRVSDGTRQGIGVLEQVVLGPYAPAGFESLADGFKG